MVFRIRGNGNREGISYAAAHTLLGNVAFRIEVDADFSFIDGFFARSGVVHLQIQRSARAEEATHALGV